MTGPNVSGDRQDVATLLAVAVAKVQLLDEAIVWRRQAPRTLGRQRQLEALHQQREAIVAALASLCASLGRPLAAVLMAATEPACPVGTVAVGAVTGGAVLAGIPAPRPGGAGAAPTTPWWAAA